MGNQNLRQLALLFQIREALLFFADFFDTFYLLLDSVVFPLYLSSRSWIFPGDFLQSIDFKFRKQLKIRQDSLKHGLSPALT